MYIKNNRLIKQDFLELGIGDWGLGIGDWGLGIGDWGLGSIPNPQSPIPIIHKIFIYYFIII